MDRGMADRLYRKRTADVGVVQHVKAKGIKSESVAIEMDVW